MSRQSAQIEPDLAPVKCDSPGDILAKRVAEAMLANDRATQHLGMEVTECREGYARLRMQIRPEFTNGHGICHGGYMFLLADSAFAFACNSYNQRAVAASCGIEFLAAVQTGDWLTAEASMVQQGKRSGLYDVEVRSCGGKLVALMRGRSATIKGQVLEDSGKSTTSSGN